jgi:hypothetical protein
MAATWACSQCHTINASGSGRCMACGAPVPATPVTVTPSVPVRPPAPPVVPAPPDITPPRSSGPPVGGGGPPPASVLSARPRTSARSGSSWARSVATGWFLGLGHVGLFVLAAFAILFRYSWGAGILGWAHSPAVVATTESWYSNRLIQDSSELAAKLPGGTSPMKFVILAAACLVIRLFRFMPGWLSLPVSLIAAFVGVVLVIADIPLLAIYWPLTIGLVIAAGIIVARTRR